MGSLFFHGFLLITRSTTSYLERYTVHCSLTCDFTLPLYLLLYSKFSNEINEADLHDNCEHVDIKKIEADFPQSMK